MSQIAATREPPLTAKPLQWQLITMLVGHFGGKLDPIPTALGAVKGVAAVGRDPFSGRVWVFGDGTVEPEVLVDALSDWGYDCCVLANQIESLSV